MSKISDNVFVQVCSGGDGILQVATEGTAPEIMTAISYAMAHIYLTCAEPAGISLYDYLQGHCEAIQLAVDFAREEKPPV